jgi:ParB family transcriptional regulator, chromosome partitioning protein
LQGLLSVHQGGGSSHVNSFKAGELTKKHMEDILSEIKKGEVTRVEFNNAQLHKFFPYNYSPAMMKREILAILKIYKEQYSEK